MPRNLVFVTLVALSFAVPAHAADSAGAGQATISALEASRARVDDLAFVAHELTARERHHAGPLSTRELETLEEQVPGGPLRVGLTRHLTRPVELSRVNLATTEGTKASVGGGLLRREADGSASWTFAIDSAGAQALRVRFDRFLLPEGAAAYVYSEDGEVYGPYTNEFVRQIVPDGYDFWTNSVQSQNVFVEVRFRGATSPLDLSIGAIAHLDPPAPGSRPELAASPEGTECFIDPPCASGDSTLITTLSSAAARLLFSDAGLFYYCSGSLVNDSNAADFIPYLLTANHCFDSQASASTLEAAWDYVVPSCGASAPTIGSRPKTLGASLLISAVAADFTFVRLNQSPPAPRSYLGWNGNTSALTNGMTFYRVAHPDGGPQKYSTSTYQTSPSVGTCTGLPTSSFAYSKGSVGGTKGGSSGGPMTNSSRQILGQLYGKCGTDVSNPCDHTVQSAVDGKFSVTYPYVQQWLSSGGGGQPCVASSTTLCAQSNRFKITLSARDPRSGTTDSGYVMASTNVFGYFAFPNIAGNQTDPQIFIKVLDGRPVNNKWWVFYASLTDVEFTLTVTDTTNGAVKSYYQDPYTQKSANDTNAFN